MGGTGPYVKKTFKQYKTLKRDRNKNVCKRLIKNVSVNYVQSYAIMPNT